MKLSQRERVMVLVGGGIALATVLVTWVLGPVWTRWCAMGDELAPKLEQLAVLRERAAGKDALLVERTRLVRELGVLCPAPPSKPKKSDAAPQEKDDAAAQAKDGAPPPQGGADAEQKRFEAELAKLISGNGGRIKLMTVAKPADALKGLRSYRAVALQVEADTNTEGLFKMLRALEKGRRYMRVDTLKLRHDLSKPDALSVTLQVTAYQRAQT